MDASDYHAAAVAYRYSRVLTESLGQVRELRNFLLSKDGIGGQELLAAASRRIVLDEGYLKHILDGNGLQKEGHESALSLHWWETCAVDEVVSPFLRDHPGENIVTYIRSKLEEIVRKAPTNEVVPTQSDE